VADERETEVDPSNNEGLTLGSSVILRSKSSSKLDKGTLSISFESAANGSLFDISYFSIEVYDHLQKRDVSTIGKCVYFVYWKITYDRTEPAIRTTK
jgi:hypothetical protein